MHEALQSAGLQPPRGEQIAPEALVSNILQASGVDLSVSQSLRQLSPGRIWRQRALDLLLRDPSETSWGWADTGSAWLLEFWRHSDERTRFILVYASPGSALAAAVSASEAPLDVDAAMQSWTRWNSELLRFSSLHPDRCILVNAAAGLRDPKKLIGIANSLLQDELNEPTSCGSESHCQVSALSSFLTQELAEEFSEAFALYAELESSAHLHDPQMSVGSSLAGPAWAEYVRSRCELEALSADLNRERRRSLGLQSELREISSARHTAIEELQQLRSSLEGSYRALADCDEREGQMASRNEALARENELLFLQLKRLQEELGQAETTRSESERRTAKLQESIVRLEAIDAKWRQLGDLTLDLRREIDGTNWYFAEHDGRWAGPGTNSTLRLPSLGPGHYELSLEIVDAMDPEILAGMSVTLCGVPLSLMREGRKFPVVLRGTVTLGHSEADGGWTVAFRFPRAISPARHGSTDTRLLAIRLRNLRLRALQNGHAETSGRS